MEAPLPPASRPKGLAKAPTSSGACSEAAKKRKGKKKKKMKKANDELCEEIKFRPFVCALSAGHCF